MTTAPSPRVEPILCQPWCKHGDGHLGEWLGALASAVIPALQVCGAVPERGGRVEQVVRRPGAVEVLTGEVQPQRLRATGSQIVAATVVSSVPAVAVQHREGSRAN